MRRPKEVVRKTRAALIAYIAKHPGLKSTEIAAGLRVKVQAIASDLWYLRDKCAVHMDKGTERYYSASPTKCLLAEALKVGVPEPLKKLRGRKVHPANAISSELRPRDVGIASSLGGDFARFVP